MASNEATYHLLKIEIPSQYRKALSERLAVLGSLGLEETDSHIIAYFPDTVDLSRVTGELSIFQALIRSADPSAVFSVDLSVLPGRDWNETWKQGFRPLDIGQRFTLLPPWESPPEGRIPIVIDPGMAFGTGHHETTRSCLLLIERFARRVARDRFLDLGTGTGILALAAHKLGFSIIDAVDNDADAIASAGRNLQLNKTTGIALRIGGIEAAGSNYAMITANLISGTLIDLSPEIAARLAPEGVAILSGILAGQEHEVIAAMTRAGLDCVERLRDGKWMSLVVQHRPSRH